LDCEAEVFSFPWWLSLAIGFLSLSEEILWVRVVGFAYQTLPFAFSFVLACYLVGIALGAAFGKGLCARIANLYAAAAIVLGVAALADALTPLLISRLLLPASSHRLAVFALAIVSTAALKSILFPIAHHLGSFAAGPRVGRSVSHIYFGNIIGATLGPLVTGFLALDHLNVDECFALAAAACLFACVGCALKSGRWQLIGVPLAAALLLSSFAMRVARPGPGALRMLAVGGSDSLTHFSANRHGVIHTVLTPVGDFVFGSNAYDGIAAVNLDVNANRLDRVYLLALLRPDAHRVLTIGLSAGAWVRALQGFPGIESIDVVEINPGYVALIRSYPELAPLLDDPRIHIYIDDGRRWLKRNPQTRYDLIVQNTTHHWRANAGNLLSSEYLTEVRRHLNPGGVVTTNTTGSFDVLTTTRAVFLYVYRYANFAYASDHPMTPDPQLLRQLRRPDGTPLAAAAAPPGSVAALLASARLEPADAFIARRHAETQVISDDNLLSEYRHGRRFGPALLRALQPPEPAHFELDDP
jgi:spermidine synthase